eukprot:Ihof_evm2s691 gene=Ihof_evmTU2s691
MKTKSEVPLHFKTFLTTFNNLHFPTRLNLLFTDQGHEYLSSKFQSFLKFQGIQPMMTLPYAAQSNGLSERMGCQLITMARTSMVDTNIPHTLWGYAIAAAAYVHNMTITSVLNNKIPPMEHWLHTHAPIERLHVYGCKIQYYLNDTNIKSKFTPKGKLGVFLGYDLSLTDDLNSDLSQVTHMSHPYDHFLDFPNCILESSVSISPVTDILMPFPVGEPTTFTNTSSEHGQKTHALLTTKSNTQYPLPHQQCNNDVFIHTAATTVTDANNDIPNILDPWNFKEALCSHNKMQWFKTMSMGLFAINEYSTWTLVPKPINTKILCSLWVLHCKRNSEKKVVFHKARLVAQGSQENKNIDYHNVSSPVCLFIMIRMLLAIAGAKGYRLGQVILKSAYLHSYFESPVYMEQPPMHHDPDKLDY